MQPNSQPSSGPIGHGVGHQHPPSKKRLSFGARTIRFELFTVIVGSALLLAAVSLYLAFSTNTGGGESRQINTKEYQALFLNNGQVYFGRLITLNDKYVVITKIFYIENSSQTTPNQQTTSNNYNLRKLGTNELHAPEDKMVINKDQITFWENLKDSSQVVTKINEYYKNPSGSSSNTTQPSTTTPSTSTTPSTTR
ncbi:hypothetical protein HYW35_02780 [Candidatus Saccharibacteria bacterium]|nr:hypothetical protein [Candidatus Saccharibacteria bacterium]